MSDDSNSELEELRIDRQRRAMLRGDGDGGASIQLHDARFTKVIVWVFSSIGAGILALLGIAANNLYQLNLTVARGIDRANTLEERLADHEVRIRTVEKDLNTIEGRVMRGIQEITHGDQPTEEGSNEPRRGR